MTDAKRMVRRRRSASAVNGIPKDLAAWFAGKGELELDSPILAPSEARLAFLRSMPERSLSRLERRELGLPVPPPEQRAPWAALIFPDYYLLPERWQAWKAANPDARPPAGWEWIDATEPFKGHAASLVEVARAAVERGRR